MSLNLFDTYIIRVRVSTCIIIFSPITVTTVLCFPQVATIASTSIFIVLLLAFTNFLPILQRHLCRNKVQVSDIAAELLYVDNPTIDEFTKQRYYKKLVKSVEDFSLFSTPSDSDSFRACCKSAIIFLRCHTRNNHLVQEENINYGFYKNLLNSKLVGLFLCFTSICVTFHQAFATFGMLSEAPSTYYFVLTYNLVLLFFWLLGVRKKILSNIATQYAKALIASIDTL